MKRVFWTLSAQKSLQQIYDFTSERWNEQIAEELLAQLDYRISQIQINPELAPTFINSQFRKIVIHQSTSLFYKITPTYIKLLLVWHNRQNPNNLLQELIDADQS